MSGHKFQVESSTSLKLKDRKRKLTTRVSQIPITVPFSMLHNIFIFWRNCPWCSLANLWRTKTIKHVPHGDGFNYMQLMPSYYKLFLVFKHLSHKLILFDMLCTHCGIGKVYCETIPTEASKKLAMRALLQKVLVWVLFSFC